MNLRSLQDHTWKLRLEVIDEFEFAGRLCRGLAFETSRSVSSEDGAVPREQGLTPPRTAPAAAHPAPLPA